MCNDIIKDKEILSLLKTDKENGNQEYPAAFEHMRAKPTADVTSCVERNRKGAEGHRAEVHVIQRVLAMRDGEPPAADLLVPPRFAQLKDKPREDLLALEQVVKRGLKRYEDVLRTASAVLEVRGP